MTHPSQTIEVEIVEIDGSPPPANFRPAEEAKPRPLPHWQSQDWQKWQKWLGRIRRLDRRWWPLWVILGTVGVLLLLTVGVVMGVILVIFRLLSRMVRAVFR